MKREFDVIVIGGGPAGLCAGIVCARNGIRTLIVEKRSFPVDKPCGEGIMPTGLANLEKLGVRLLLSRGSYHPFAGIRYISPSGQSAESSFAEGPGWGVQRTDLSSALFQCARQMEHLTILENTSPVLDRDSSGKPLVWVDRQCFAPRLLIGADGLHSEVRKWAGLTGKKQSLKRWGVRRHGQIQPWSPLVEVHWKPGVEAYITPVAANRVGVAFLWDFKKIPRMKGGTQLFDSLLQCFPTLHDKLKDAPFTDAAMATGPLYQTASSLFRDNVLLMGDAAGYLDAITGEGISLVTEQALAFENIVVPAFAGGGELASTIVQHYTPAYQKIVNPYYRVTHLVLWLRNHPQLIERVIGGLARDPKLFQRMLSINMGVLPPWRIPPRQLWAFAKSLLVHE